MWSSVQISPKRNSPIGPDFFVAHINATANSKIQFVLTNGGGLWDNPSQNCEPSFCSVGSHRNYAASAPGTYVLFSGCLSRFDAQTSKLKTPGLVVVTDIDGTLYGCEEAMKRLYELWARNLALAGGYLVFNTGRSIESVVKLVRDNRKHMPVPVAAITRVGSYVHWFRPPPSRTGSHIVETLEWEEWYDLHAAEPCKSDYAWHCHLSSVEGWDHHRYRALLDCWISGVTSSKGHWLDNGANDPFCFRLAVSIRTEHLDETLQHLQEQLRDEPIKLIVSGEGDYRYLDVTLDVAGKLGGTLHCLRVLHSEFGHFNHAVFCGDSGNDIDALQGDVKGIVVANAQKDLLAAVEKSLVTKCQKSDQLRKQQVFKTKAPFADGIIEGLQLHGFL